MTTDHGNDNSQHDMPTTGPENSLIPEGLDIKPIITLEEGGATPAGSIVPASGASSLTTGSDAALSSLFPTGTGATALPGTSYQASPQSHGTYPPFARPDRVPPFIWIASPHPLGLRAWCLRNESLSSLCHKWRWTASCTFAPGSAWGSVDPISTRCRELSVSL